MNNFVLYSKSNSTQQHELYDAFVEYLDLFSWKYDKNERILDIGCNNGDNTVEIIEKFLPKNKKALIGIDILSDAIEYANKKYRNNVREFYNLSISDDFDKLEFLGKFDHITSSYTLNWPFDQKYNMHFN